MPPQPTAPANTPMTAMAVTSDFGMAPVSVAIPSCPTDGALLRLNACGLCGSDVEKLRFQKASAGSILGHEVVATLVEIGPQYQGHFQIGDRLALAHHVPCGHCVYCRHDAESMCAQFKATNLTPGGFAEVIAVTGGHLAHTAFKVPKSVSDAQASGLEPLACVLKGIRRGALPGNRVLIIGLGYIGLLAAQVYTHQGVHVVGVDVRSGRVKQALDWGWVAEGYTPEALPNTSLQVDGVFASMVTQTTIESSLHHVRDGGTLVLFSRGFGTPEPTLPCSDLYFRQITVVPSYSPGLHDLQQAAHWLFDGTINAEKLITHSLPLKKLPEGLKAYQTGNALKVLATSALAPL
ncbi:MAG: alcohol dehydrogenase catalytic domain-containing protein [Vampirovibrionales bacterium]|nr:alcohol dehydrogenase catalytic domain-containing protein [Vampirovibrionales bacterium]